MDSDGFKMIFRLFNVIAIMWLIAVVGGVVAAFGMWIAS